MATLPDATAFGARETAGPSLRSAAGVANYAPVNLTAGLSNELRGAGHEAQQASAIIDATNADQDMIVAEAGLNRLHEDKASLEFDPKTGFRNIKEGGTVGQQFLDGYMGKFNDAAKAISDGLQNDRQRKLFKDRAPVAALQYRSALMQHQAVQTEAFNDSTANGTIEGTLRGIAQRPNDDLSFAVGQARVNATIDGVAKRKGLPAEEVKALKAKYMDAAYTSRIMAVLDGVPGVVARDPYRAEGMFKMVADQLGPQALLHLSQLVQSGVKDVQMRDGARAEVFGGGAMDPRMVYPAIEGVKPLQAPEVVSVIKQMESRGQRFGPDGSLLTSRTGAQGEMQVQPSTAADPGFGVRPASDLNDPDELARVGRETAGAMTARYGHPALVLASYNAGAGAVDKWLAKYGDPRTGKVSVSDWIAQIPFSETKKYVTEGMRKLSGAAADQPVSGPSVNQIKAETLPALLDRARAHAEAMYPNDPRFVDGYVARTLQNANQVLGAEQARQAAAHDTLTQALVGTKGDGSDAVKTIDQAMANPSIRAAFETATPEGRLAFQTRLATGDKKWDQKGIDIYYAQLGMESERPNEFRDATKNDLSKLYGSMPDTAVLNLMSRQRGSNLKQEEAQLKDFNWSRAKTDIDDMLKAAGLGSAVRKNDTTGQKKNDDFYGRLKESFEQFHLDNKKWPNTTEIQRMAAGLLVPGKQRRTWGGFYDSSVRQYEVAPGNMGDFYVPLPDPKTFEYTEMVRKFTAGNKGEPPKSQSELQKFWNAYKAAGYK